MKQTYEEIIHFINELPKTEFYNNPEIIKRFLSEYNKYHLPNELIEKIEEDHENIVKMSADCKIIKFKEPFKYICKTKHDTNPVVINIIV